MGGRGGFIMLEAACAGGGGRFILLEVAWDGPEGGGEGRGGTSILGITGDVQLDRVPFWAFSFGTGCHFWASGIGTGSFYKLSTLGTRLACILLIFQAIISRIPSHFFQPNSLKML